MFKRLDLDLRESLPSRLSQDLQNLRFKNLSFLTVKDSEETLMQLKGENLVITLDHFDGKDKLVPHLKENFKEI